MAIPLDINDYMEIGYIVHKRIAIGKFGILYIEALKEYMQSDEYAKQVAREKLGLVEGDEIIFKEK